MPTLSNDKQGQQFLSVTLFDFFQTVSVYGKDPESLQSMVRLFNIALADYTIDEVKKAFSYYLLNFKGMPEPADIVTIIERKGKPPFDRSVYISIQKKQPDERTQAEWQYKKDYEKFMIEGEY